MFRVRIAEPRRPSVLFSCVYNLHVSLTVKEGGRKRDRTLMFLLVMYVVESLCVSNKAKNCLCQVISRYGGAFAQKRPVQLLLQLLGEGTVSHFREKSSLFPISLFPISLFPPLLESLRDVF